MQKIPSSNQPPAPALKPKPSLISPLLNLAKKIYYDSVFRVKIVLHAQHNPTAHILGRHYHTKKQIQHTLTSIMWLTYRQNIQGSYVNSDVGWGCMIRVGQMLLAQTFRRHLGLERTCSKQELLSILTAFIDDDEGLENIGNYSIQKITKEAVREYGMRVGEWHSPSSISYVLQNLHHRNPLRGTEKIRVYVGQTCLFFDDAYKQMGENTNSLLIIILCMVGLDSPDLQKIEAIKKLMTLRFFNGMLGGIPKKAYYFVGKTDQNFIYLDPHVVHQGASRRQIQIDLPSFFCNYYISLKSQQIHPSLGLCFYVSNLLQLYQLFQGIYDLKVKSLDLPFFFSKNAKQPYKSMKESVVMVREIEDECTEVEVEKGGIGGMGEIWPVEDTADFSERKGGGGGISQMRCSVFQELKIGKQDIMRGSMAFEELRFGNNRNSTEFVDIQSFDFQEIPKELRTSAFEVVPLEPENTWQFQ